MQFDKFVDNLDKEVNSLEEKLLAKKPWYFQGETGGKDRTENALLAEHLEVQRHAIYKPAPFDETIIQAFLKKGIRANSYDNAVFKVKTKEHVSATKAFESTAKTSLVEDYENLYAKAKALENVQEDPEKEQLRRDIVELFDNLDALSNMHFVPSKRIDGYNILVNKQALAMEEAGPTATAKTDLLAPEEILEPRGEPLKGATEVTTSDRRRHRKKLMRVRAGKRQLRVAIATKSKDRRAAMDKIVKMAHKPGSKITIAK